MIEIPALLVCGTNGLWDAERNRWVQGKCWIIVLAYHPYRVVRIPKIAVLSECQAGDRDVVLECASWPEVVREVSEELWRMEMNQLLHSVSTV